MTTVERAMTADEFVLSEIVEPGQRLLHRPSLLRRVLIVLDAVAVVVSWVAALALNQELIRSAQGPVTVPLVVLLSSVSLVAIASQRLYLARMCTIRAVEIGRLARACLIAGAVAGLAPRLLPVSLSNAAVVLGAGLMFLSLVTTRGAYRYWLQVGRREGRFLRPVLVVGANDEGWDLCKLLTDHPELGYRVVGVVGSEDDAQTSGITAPVLGPVSQTLRVVEATGANGAIVAASALPTRELNALVRSLLRAGVHVHLSSGLRGLDHRRLIPQPMAHEPLFYVEPLTLAPWQFGVKRLLDVVGAVAAAVVLSPVLLVAAVLVKLSDRGPVLYRQQRVGRHGVDFTIFKFRTMIPNADRMYGELAYEAAGRDGPLIKLANDPRRTRVGRVLERLSIDELPQLWNVIKGEMSLVGPRPAQRSEVDAFDPELKARLEVPPGISGLWQVEARDNPSFAAYRRYDLFYIENWSVMLDIAILVATIQRVLLRGAVSIIRNTDELDLAKSAA